MATPLKLKSDNNARLVIIVCMLMLLWPALNAPLALLDDHDLIVFNSGAATKELYDGRQENATLPGVFKRELEYGRCRFAYWTVKFTLVKLFGANARLHHIFQMLTGIFTALAFFSLLRKYQVRTFNALIVVLLFACGEQASCWYYLGPSEAFACLFFFLGWNFMNGSMRKGILAAVFFFLAGLCKETFILTVPAVLLIDLWHREQLRMEFKSILMLNRPVLLSLFFSVAVLGVVILNKGEVYATDQPEPFLQVFISNILHVFWTSAFFISATFFILNGRISRKALQLMLLSLCWVGLGLLAYYKTTLQVRYYIPAVIGPLIFLGFMLEQLSEKPGLYRMMLLPLAALLINQSKNVLLSANRYCTESRAYGEAIDWLAENAKDELIIYGKFPDTFEIIYSTADQLAYRNAYPKISLALSMQRKNDNFASRLEAKLKKSFDILYPQDLRSSPGEADISRLVFTVDDVPAAFQWPLVKVFQETYSDISFKTLELKKDTVKFVVLETYTGH